MTNLLQKLGIGILGGSLVFGAAQKADAQQIYSYNNHNKGAVIEKDKIRVKNGEDLEVKMLQGRGQYFQNIPLFIEDFPKNPKNILPEDLDNTFQDTLGLVSFYRNTAQYDLDAYTKGFLKVSSKEPYIWVRAKDKSGKDLNVIPLSLKINPKTGKPEIYSEVLCDNQLNKKNGITDKNASYIARENLEEILKQLTNNLHTIDLNRNINGQKIRTNFYFPAASDSTVYLIPNIAEYTKLRILPARKNKNGVTSRIRQVAIVSPLGVYEQVRTKGEVNISNVPTSSISGTVVNPYHESFRKEKKEIKQNSAKSYFILGANANQTFAEGNLGIQYGPIALVGNYGQAKDEVILQGTTSPSPVTGRYAKIKEWNDNIKLIGISTELHAFSNKNISPFVGGGVEKWDYTKNKAIKTFGKSGQPLGSTSESKLNSENSWRTYGGFNFKAGKNSKLGVQAGYSQKQKFFAGVRYSIKLGK